MVAAVDAAAAILAAETMKIAVADDVHSWI